MRILIYAGPAPAREAVLRFSAQFARSVATEIALVTGGGTAHRALLDSAAALLDVPDGVPLAMLALPGDAQAAILAAAHEQPFDLVIFGRLHQPIARLLPGAHSRAIAQRLEPSVLRVHGVARRVRRILLCSGGDRSTLASAAFVARIAVALGAAVTVMHVVSQQSLVFNEFPLQHSSVEEYLESDTMVATTLREATRLFELQGVQVQVRARVGPVLDEIMAELRVGNYELLAVGAHRVASALDRILLEDITGDLLDISPLPVLVVKTPGALEHATG